MDFPLYSDVILTQDLPEEGLQAGDVGVVVAEHDVAGRERGYSVEFFDMVGNTLAVVTVPAHELRAPTTASRLYGPHRSGRRTRTESDIDVTPLKVRQHRQIHTRYLAKTVPGSLIHICHLVEEGIWVVSSNLLLSWESSHFF